MPRTDLVVPYSDKEEAKILGAAWDPEKRCWYTEARDLQPFARWRSPQAPTSDPVVPAMLPEPELPCVRAPRFALITASTRCWKCHASIAVSAVVLDQFEEQDPEYGDWSAGTDRTMLQCIATLNMSAHEAINAATPWLKPGFSRTVDAVYLANHCTHCAALQGEWFLTEPGAVFFPSDGPMPVYEISVFDVPLEAQARGSGSSWLDGLRI
jgi:hypothetical protein